MADVETKVKIGADTSGLKKIGEESRKAFDPKRPKDLQRSTQELDKAVERLVKTQTELSTELIKVERGSKAYKDLARELRQVQREADSLRKSLNDIDRVSERTAQRQQQRQSFVAGLAQGAGVAQYIPTGAGMVPRMAGAGIGGMMRRGVGGAAAPFSMPGVGGLAGALSAIPVIGGAASQSLMAGLGYYQKAIAFSGQRMGNIPYADLDARGPMIANPEVARSEAKIAELQKQRRAALASMGRIKAKDLTDEEKGSLKGDNYIQAMAVGGRVPGGQTVKSNVRHVAARKLNVETVETGAKEFEAQIKREQERLKKLPKGIEKDVSGIPGEGFGATMGFSPGEMQQFFGGVMAARGGISSQKFKMGGLRQAMAASRLYGVSAQQAGSFFRMGMPGGGGSNVNLGQAIGTAVAQGLSGSQISEYLGTLVQQGKQMEQQGIKFDMRDLTGTSMMLSGAGFEKLQASRVAAGVQGSARGVAAKGAQSPMDLLMLRAAGYDPSQGAGGYARAIGKLEGGMSPEMLQRYVGLVKEGTAGGGFDPDFRKLLVKRALGRAGVSIGMDQAGKLLSGDVTMQTLQGMDAGAGDLEGRAIAATRRFGGLKAAQAGIEAEQIGIGRDLAPVYIKLEKIGDRSVKTLSRFSGALESAADTVYDVFGTIDKVAKAINTATSIGDFFSRLGQDR